MHSKIRELADIPPNQRNDYFGVILDELFSARMKSNFSIAHTNGGTGDSRSFYIAQNAKTHQWCSAGVVTLV